MSSAKNSAGSKTAKPSAKNSAGSKTAKLSAKNSAGSKTAKPSAKNSAGSKTAKPSAKNSAGSKTVKPKVQWKTLKGLSKYKISSDGRIFSYFLGRCMKPQLKGGYYQVHLYYDNGNYSQKGISVLVASAFKKNPKNYEQVDHIDGNKLNNNVSNLRWFTISLNVNHYYDNFAPKRAVLQCDRNGNVIKKWDCLKDIILENPTYELPTIRSNISKCKSSYGFMWKYEKNKPKKQIVFEKDEILKSIGIFEDHDLSEYQISNYGKIKSNYKVKNKKGIFLSPKIRGGYMTINLIDK